MFQASLYLLKPTPNYSETMSRRNYRHTVVTDDSDLLVYSAAIGVPFPIIFKLDHNLGSCDVMDMSCLFPPSKIAFDQENQVMPFNKRGSMTLQKGSKFCQYLQSFQLKENKTTE